MGFAPMNRGFADPRLRPLGYVAFKNLMVPRRRLELLQPSGHSALNAACLPIPPPRHRFNQSIFTFYPIISNDLYHCL